MFAMKDLESYINEAIKNIRSDRAITTTLLMELMEYMKKDDEKKESVGTIAAKYVETLQRSNEQLVKLCGLMSKNEKTDELTDKDFAQIFDQIQKSEDK